MTISFLTICDLSIRFGGLQALNGVSLSVEQGQIVGLIGPNGAGKTTVFNCITRIYRPATGSIQLQGRELLVLHPHQIITQGVARTFQNLALFASMTVLENLLVGQHTCVRYNLLQAICRLPGVVKAEQVGRTRAAEVLAFLELAHLQDRVVHTLPYSLKKRVELACALVARPQLLLLDEPAAGLHHEEVDALAGTICRLRDELGITILLVEHHMGLVMNVSNRVCVLNSGRKIAEGIPTIVQQDPAVMEAYLGDDAMQNEREVEIKGRSAC